MIVPKGDGRAGDVVGNLQTIRFGSRRIKITNWRFIARKLWSLFISLSRHDTSEELRLCQETDYHSTTCEYHPCSLIVNSDSIHAYFNRACRK
jgi:hypothetical protein